MIYTAFDIRNAGSTQCSEQTWNMLPETYEEAVAKGQNYIRGKVYDDDEKD